MVRLQLSIVIALAACASDRDPIDDPQLPPRGDADLQGWLGAAYYEAWRCQPDVHVAMDPSPHPSARICSNELIYATADGEFPVGAATVKELFDPDGAPHGHAVSRKVSAGSGGASWYWYEANVDGIYADGTSEPTCINCHTGAARDFVWTMAP